MLHSSILFSSLVMFHIEDDFDFDDDLLDTTTISNDNSKLEEESNKIQGKSEYNPLSINNVAPQFFENKAKNSATDREVEFLNCWQPEKGSGLNISSAKKSDVTTRHVRKTVRRRKFPGPAGLLPERQGNTSFIATEEFLDDLNSENEDTTNFKEKEVLSQRSERAFESGAWGALMEDLGTSGMTLISRMNLASLRIKHTRGYKVPFLAVIINNIDCTLPDPTLVVKDPTDEMHGMLHREVWEKYNTEMVPGSVLVLKNVGVISAGSTSRRHVLNITSNNLIAIYSNRQDEHIEVERISELPTGDNSRILAEEWDKLVSTPVSSEKIFRNTPPSSGCSGKSGSTTSYVFNSPTTSTPQLPNIKQSFIRRQLMKGQPVATPPIKNSFLSEQPVKRHKNVQPNVSSAKCTKTQTNLFPTKSNTFKIDNDTSVVDSLLDGIDTESLFEEF